MEITINQQSKRIPAHCTITHLLNSLMPNGHNGIAVAVNQQVIPKVQWPLYRLKPNDHIVLIKATPGG